MSKNTKPPRKSGKQKHYSKEEVRKINERYQSMLEKYKSFLDEELNEVLKSNKTSSTDKQAAYDEMRLRLQNKTPKAVVKTEEAVEPLNAE